MGSEIASYTVKIPSGNRALSDVRIESTSWLESRLAAGARRAEVIADAAVVLTELASNVIDHTSSESIELGIEITPTDVVIEVGNHGAAGGLPDVSLWGVLEQGDRGRGLRIVRAICRDIQISGNAQFTRIRASIDRR